MRYLLILAVSLVALNNSVTFAQSNSFPSHIMKNFIDRLDPTGQSENIRGVEYATGKNVLKNEKEAFKWFQRSAEKGNTDGQFNLGKCYITGFGVSQDFRLAKIWMYKAAEKNYLPAQHLLGTLYINDENYIEAEKWIRKAALQGQPISQYMLGMMYLEGKGVPENSTLATKWLLKAANQNLPEAQLALDMIAHTFSKKERIEWLSKAANQGNYLASKLMNIVVGLS